jgi:hypothetical protein
VRREHEMSNHIVALLHLLHLFSLVSLSMLSWMAVGKLDWKKERLPLQTADAFLCLFFP